MKRVIASTLVAALMGVSSIPAAYALTATSDFTVSVQLAGRCTATNSGTQTLNFGTYTAFQNTDKTGSVGLTFNCTRGLLPTSFSFDTNSYGVLAGLNYSLAAAAAVTTAGGAASAAAGGTGSADVVTVTVSGTMPQGQAGACGAGAATAAACDAAATTATRTLTVTY